MISVRPFTLVFMQLILVVVVVRCWQVVTVTDSNRL